MKEEKVIRTSAASFPIGNDVWQGNLAVIALRLIWFSNV
jgi:hypothetical protein